MTLRLRYASRVGRPLRSVARYHDYIRAATPGTNSILVSLLSSSFLGGVARIPLSSPKIIGIVNSRGNRAYCFCLCICRQSLTHFSHQEDFYAYATLSLDPEELRSSVKKSLGIDWHPEKVGHAFNRQAVFIGIYDGYASSNSFPSIILNRFQPRWFCCLPISTSRTPRSLRICA